ncbi:MAG TPA: VOC family protein [Candidatus Binatia bacterium]|jgi:lactoylglutathione lyase
MAVVRFGHIGICVSDLSRSVPFYRDLLGFRAMTQTDVRGEDADRLLGLRGVDQTTVFLERDGVRLALFEFRAPKSPPPDPPRQMNRTGLAAIMLRVDDLDATLAKMREASVTVLDSTRTDYPAYGSRLVFVADPDGTLVELVEIPGDPYIPFGKPL